MAKDAPRFLLVSTRLDDFMQNHELGCLVRAGQLAKEDFRVFNATSEPITPDLAEFDAVFIHVRRLMPMIKIVQIMRRVLSVFSGSFRH